MKLNPFLELNTTTEGRKQKKWPTKKILIQDRLI